MPLPDSRLTPTPEKDDACDKQKLFPEDNLTYKFSSMERLLKISLGKTFKGLLVLNKQRKTQL